MTFAIIAVMLCYNITCKLIPGSFPILHQARGESEEVGSCSALSVVGHGSGVQRDQNLWSCIFEHTPKTVTLIAITATHIHHKQSPHSHKCPIMFISHFMCVQILHITNSDVPAGVGAPPLNIELPFQRLIFSSGRNLVPGI